MSSPVYWPTERFFEPIGRTSAVSLTRDLPPEADANILLLDCNDCRNVFFTVFCEHPKALRKLDFTCSDVDPAILARATILFTMAIDGVPCDTVWNIFYHIYLDEESLATLVTHCRKLVSLTECFDKWAESAYGAVIRFGSTYTLSEVHRLLSLYTNSDSITKPMPADGAAESARDWALKNVECYDHSSARSAGPMHKYAERVFGQHFELYCQTGTTYTDGRDQDSALHQNPTLYYSRHGPDSVVHPCVDPLAPFHTAPVFGNADSDRVSVVDVVGAARREFSLWCRAFRAVAAKTGGLLIVRFLLGDPLAVAHTLEHFCRWKMRTSLAFVAPWSAQVLELSAEEYERYQAPSMFNVIDTSTLWDTVGMYNILPTVVPILSPSVQTNSVVYTESLVRWGDNPKTGLAGYRFELFSETALWIDLCPVDFLAMFSSRYGSDDRIPATEGVVSLTRRHVVLAWKRPCSGDIIAHSYPSPRLSFLQPDKLASLLYQTYHALFGPAQWTIILIAGMDVWHRGIEHTNDYYCTRESFVYLLKCVRERFSITSHDWDEAMEIFLERSQRRIGDPTMASREQLCDSEFRTQLFRHGIYTSPGMDRCAKPPTGRLSLWSAASPLVRIFLVVPRAELDSTLSDTVMRHGTSALTVSLGGNCKHGWYQCLHPVFGSVVDMGTDTTPDVHIEEDSLGMCGTSDLVVSFVVDTAALSDGAGTSGLMDVEIELFIFASLEELPMTAPGNPVHRLTIFQTTLEDKASVFISPESFPPLLDYSMDAPTRTGSRADVSPLPPMPIGDQGVIQVHPVKDEAYGHNVTCFQANLAVHDARIADLLRAHGTELLQVELVSYCTMRLTLADAGLVQDVIFPLPIMRTKPLTKLGLHVSSADAVTIELTTQAASAPIEAESFQLNATPVILNGGDSICPWGIHRVNLDRMPVVNLHAPGLEQWLLEHIWTQHSALDAMLSSSGKQYTPPGATLWRLPKESLFCALYRPFTGTGVLNKFGKVFRIIRLCETSALDHALGPTDTILFMCGLRYDLTAHTVVADAYVLTIASPLTWSILAPLEEKDTLGPVPLYGEELRMWKQLLPAAAERCRSWSHGPNCEYKATGRIPLDTRLHAGDPLCSCGRGKDVEGLRRVKAWAAYAPHVTRIALSPLFPTWYLEPLMMKFLRRAGWMTSDWEIKQTTQKPPHCSVCQRVKYDLKKCARCWKVTYCSEECQREDWPRHKKNCIGLIKK